MKSSGLKLSFSKPCCPRLFASLVNSIADASSQEGEPFFYSYGRPGGIWRGIFGWARHRVKRGARASYGDVVEWF